MKKNEIKCYICVFIIGFVIGFIVKHVINTADSTNAVIKYTENIDCEMLSDSRLHDEFYNKKVTGSIVGAAVDLYNDLCIVIVNKELSNNNYAIVNNLSLWIEDELRKDDYGYYVNEELFNERLRYDENCSRYIASDFVLGTRCNSKLTVAGYDSYVSPLSIYESYLIRTEAGEVIGVVFFEV